VILTSLPDDSALAQVALSEGGLVHFLTPGAIDISMSTISPDLSRRLSEQHQLAGQGYVAAPVLGNPDLPHARKLFFVIAAGAAPALTTASPLLERLGQRLFLMGEDPGTANLMKLAGNALAALTLKAWAKSSRCCEKVASMSMTRSRSSRARCSTARCTRHMAVK
jgi:3-hydroxyisobutyrate dehydrogenase-like beta-hydroxyacid dehydrogenase